MELNPLRPALLAASKSGLLKQVATHTPLTKSVVERFVAGETRPDVLRACDSLLASGRRISVDFLGENVTTERGANSTAAEYVELIRDLARLPASDGALEVSVKLSALGQSLERVGERVATENLTAVCRAAEKSKVLVTVDAEGHDRTDSTHRIVHSIRREFPWLGIVLQAYLRRCEADCARFAGRGSRVRLCKGAYREPPSVAYQERDQVTGSYLRCADILMRGDGYPMIASHDPKIIAAMQNSTRAFEHQMLFGIRNDEQLRLVAAGRSVRVYVPYGKQWYAYFMRRLAERPANLTFFLRALAGQ
ncbi:proline dehydrogenase family protein [Smaragdicoccus niigatensis]|uniref:proline dehydrogenase family protein n=1 Tax=Smaragdicoccus niigatensis TaxID=359359 RepID=UPI000371C308|nr:proline dehydrogenase family protein [Smaragdicoccus niigatensis]